MIRELWPLLGVRDIERSLAFYRDRLGFSVAGQDGGEARPTRWARVERDGVSLMLQQSDNAGRAGVGDVCLYFVCDDADSVHAELLARGLSLNEPEIAYYGMKQLELVDPDGHALCFESPTSPT